MPRPLRAQIPDGIYHVTSRGNRRQPTFLDSDDHRFQLWCVDRTVARYGWTCGSWCHMPNHFHLLIQTPAPNLSRGMQDLNGLYGQVFNDRHGYDGHVFQGRFHSKLVDDDSHLLVASRYIEMNPVRAGICAHPLEWRWSSCRAAMGLVAKPDFLDLGWLFGHFGRDLEEARRRYFAFIEEALQETG
jgi:REP element-mobilizing transposase RayT